MNNARLLRRRIISFFMVMVLLVIMLFSALVTTMYPWLAHHVQPAGWWAWLTWLQGWSKVLFPRLCSSVSYFLPLPSFAPCCVAIRGSGCTRGDASLDLGRKLFVWDANHLVRYYLIYGTLTAVMFSCCGSTLAVL